MLPFLILCFNFYAPSLSSVSLLPLPVRNNIVGQLKKRGKRKEERGERGEEKRERGERRVSKR